MTDVDSRVFPAARTVLDDLLADLAARAPGLFIGAHITGSIALGDGRPDRSDIDLVLVRDSAADNASTMAALEPALATLQRTRPRPTIDGLVIDEHDLAIGPDRIEGERPIIFDNVARLGTDASGRNPVTWKTLRQCGVAFRGAPLDHDRLWHDPARLDSWTRGNLEAYWRPWVNQAERLSSHPDVADLIDEATEWAVLGVTRLHYTLATGRIASKHGAGVYALEALPTRWHPIIEDAIRIRERSAGPPRISDPAMRAQTIREYLTMVIDDALALPYIASSQGSST